MNIEKRDFFTAKMAQAELRNQEPPATTTTFKKSVLICCELNSTGVILEKQIIKKTNIVCFKTEKQII